MEFINNFYFNSCTVDCFKVLLEAETTRNELFWGFLTVALSVRTDIRSLILPIAGEIFDSAR